MQIISMDRYYIYYIFFFKMEYCLWRQILRHYEADQFLAEQYKKIILQEQCFCVCLFTRMLHLLILILNSVFGYMCVFITLFSTLHYYLWVRPTETFEITNLVKSMHKLSQIIFVKCFS